MKKKKANKFLDWFFEEDQEVDPPQETEDSIEINLIQVVMIIIITLLFAFFVFKSYLKTYFSAPNLGPRDYIESKIEKNYFENRNIIENSDFKDGLSHWVTSDGGKLFPDSKSIIKLVKSPVRSAPYSIKIESKHPANRYHYSKKRQKYIIDNAYGFEETDHWLGVIPNSQVKASLWYKGDPVRFAINGLKSNGQWFSVGTTLGGPAKKWRSIEIDKVLPKDCRAIMLEIALNQAQDMPLPVVFIDDVKLSIKSQKE